MLKNVLQKVILLIAYAGICVTTPALYKAVHAQTRTQTQTLAMRPPDGGGSLGGSLGGSVPVRSSPTAKVNRGIAALNTEVRNRTWYSWGGGHGQFPGRTYGTEHRLGFDCSGLSRWFVYKATGRDLLGSGTATSQLARAHALGAKKISPANWYRDRKPGDLLFYGHSRIHHVLIYVGNGYIIEAPHSNARVRKGRFYKSDFSVAMRLPF